MTKLILLFFCVMSTLSYELTYKAFNTQVNFRKAQQLCKSKGMGLAFIPGPVSYKRIMKQIGLKVRSNKPAWIGIVGRPSKTGDTKWSWINKVSSKTPKPLANAKKGGNCVALSDKKLFKVKCNRKLPFVCYGDERLR